MGVHEPNSSDQNETNVVGSAAEFTVSSTSRVLVGTSYLYSYSGHVGFFRQLRVIQKFCSFLEVFLSSDSRTELCPRSATVWLLIVHVTVTYKLSILVRNILTNKSNKRNETETVLNVNACTIGSVVKFRDTAPQAFVMKDFLK